ncbi:hypothetical protein [Furfurilactobacillus curtus]|uniref:PepSY domain-containing protein n=1 Tax=Furfurilactobacillus curtus TaxID=1746200 RepID=A0ABQ5JQD6_9LACO
MSTYQPIEKILFFAGLGVATGVSIGAAIQKAHSKRPERILADVKTSFRKSGALSGAWIEHHPVIRKIDTSPVEVYSGGIIQQAAKSTVVYAFLADSQTGKVVDVWKIAPAIN